jgi:hypothetical protein
MDELDRLFRYLVNYLAASAPEKLKSPFQVSELYQTLIPYRRHRSELKFEAIEDYEMALLRLLGGERGYVTVDPVDAQEAIAAEAESVNPDTGAFRQFAAASVSLKKGAVAQVLDQQAAYAPPGYTTPEQEMLEELEEPETEEVPPIPTLPETRQVPQHGPPAVTEPEPQLVFETVEASCPHCHTDLPAGRTVVYCPSCGRQVQEAKCPRCGDPLESGWQFCVTCGHTIGT